VVRYVDGTWTDYGSCEPAEGLIPLTCAELEPGTTSCPHSVKWIEDEEAVDFGLLRDPDGIPMWLTELEHAEGLE
jgi:hypothetical protein